jgi:hypothetical protein
MKFKKNPYFPYKYFCSKHIFYVYFTVNLSFLKRYRDRDQTFFSRLYIYLKTVLVINLDRLMLVLSVKNIKTERLF